ncbi:AI-2E family transporter [Halalkalibacterium halodurans]|uniref:BH1266 protein n=1 Tax=Halalkalibacterium halodurans (strain ATCC BAA-125 / DSM 18197 / FERM 7344 / JCM 9153 / C-125) TaxID=272558 RepID=Q9KDE7_HALH5|nr:AI-2E family transporter [Halalkalibacterium halodurans]MDY7221792.1 AI-2E family transporter [Halalkalibacterium halodurans]MDY7241068.1 AI-2E family transporter [Halalkalibacterium halodurans]MED4081883.1 AI-2E family transporter [Halalkalibacterium halodurans]MED4086009.1 AI-2E family transporter [Halalkalibacterium halodurans]MED4106817.1 AI-2E family transporter [Halalkalibacterium halodurans]
MERDQHIRIIYKLIIVLLVLLIIYVVVQLADLWVPFVYVLKRLLIPLGLAAIITYLFHPLIEAMHRRGMGRGLAVLLVFGAMIALLVCFAVVGAPYVLQQIEELTTSFPTVMKDVEGTVSKMEWQIQQLPHPFHNQAENWLNHLGKKAGNLLGQMERVIVVLIQSMVLLITVPFLVLYFLKDFDLIERAAWYVTPRKWRPSLKRYVRDVDRSFGRYIRGQLLVALSVAVVSMMALWLIGVPYPILLGGFIGATNIIPYFGAFIGAVPALVFAYFESWPVLLATAIALFLLQQLEGNVLSPLIVGHSLHLHPITIILALLVGVEVGGVIGLILAVPILAVLKVTFIHLRLHVSKVDREV